MLPIFHPNPHCRELCETDGAPIWFPLSDYDVQRRTQKSPELGLSFRSHLLYPKKLGRSFQCRLRASGYAQAAGPQSTCIFRVKNYNFIKELAFAHQRKTPPKAPSPAPGPQRPRWVFI